MAEFGVLVLFCMIWGICMAAWREIEWRIMRKKEENKDGSYGDS